MNASKKGVPSDRVRPRALDGAILPLPLPQWETDKIRKLVSSPSFDRFTIFGNEMASIHIHKTRLVLNKPVYTEMTILENSKLLMYDFYNHLKARNGPKCELIYTDTDSLLLNIPTEDVYKDMKEDLWLYDTSNYPKDNPHYDYALTKRF